MGFPHITLEFPYKRQSPVTKRVKTYKNIEQVWEEIFELTEGWRDSRFSLGRNLYFHLPLFMNPKWIIDNEDGLLMREYQWIKEFNIPLAQDLDSADASKIEIFDTIRNEINGIKLYMSEQNGR
jgi:hypothetical protein|tara:strand:- start:157 stop:528 length:372 start_codon:yes stop_codon:yes gene_type:complete